MTRTDAFDDFPTSSTLFVTVQDDSGVYQAGLDAIERRKAGTPVDEPDTFSFASVEMLFETFTPRPMQFLETIERQEPDSIRETARFVDRDVKNVQEELTQLERLGLLTFEQEGRTKRPVFPDDELLIRLPFADDAHDSAPALS